MNATNAVALDIAIQLAGIVQWFEGGFKVGPTYSLIVFTLEQYFDPNKKVYPGLRDRAYYCAQAILWIYICACHVSTNLEVAFPLPFIHYDTICLDHDLKHLGIFGQGNPGRAVQVYYVDPGFTPMHLEWTSNALLHLSWAKQKTPWIFNPVVEGHTRGNWSTMPLDVALNCLLTWCIFLN